MNRGVLRLAGGGLILVGVFLLAHRTVILLSPNSYVSAVRFKPPEKELLADDPYWPQDQMETLQSKSILYRVITNLDLTRKCADKLHKLEPLRIEVVTSNSRSESTCVKAVAQA